MSEKPLHVRVAEVLDWNKGKPMEASKSYPPNWFISGECGHTGFSGFAPRYDTDWSATGPLMKRLRIGVSPSNRSPSEWEAYHASSGETTLHDEPLMAVCNLILALKETGKLEVSVGA